MRFNARAETHRLIDFVQNYFREQKLYGAVVGLSGGKDSSVAAALLVRALGSDRVVGVTMPCETSAADMDEAQKLAQKLNIETINFDLYPIYETFVRNWQTNIDEKLTEALDHAKVNLQPRLRMSTLYFAASALTADRGKPYIVAGTSNKSEIYVGYFTKGGDQTYDLGLLNDFTVSEVIAIGEYLGIDKKLLCKPPADGLSGQTDEQKLGVSYDEIENYLYARPLDENTKKKIARLHDSARHKYQIPAYHRPRIGVFVGSFDPLHRGHEQIISYLIQYKLVDEILLIPTDSYWDKKPMATHRERVQMAKMIENNQVHVDGNLGKLAHTWEILAALENKYSPDDIFLIMGADNLVHLHRWEKYEWLLAHNIIVVNRDHINMQAAVSKLARQDNFVLIEDFLPAAISSSYIRTHLDEAFNGDYLHPQVARYIKQNTLYHKLS